MSVKTTKADRTYSYRARAQDGEVVTGTVSGSTPDDIAAILRSDGLVPTAIRTAGAALPDFDADEIRFWEVLANVKWAVVCLYQGALFVRGIVPGLEFGAIGRRVTEPLYDLARWLETGKD